MSITFGDSGAEADQCFDVEVVTQECETPLRVTDEKLPVSGVVFIDEQVPIRWQQAYDQAIHLLRERLLEFAEVENAINPDDPPLITFIGHIGVLYQSLLVRSAATEARNWAKIAFPNRERTPTQAELIAEARRLIFY